MHHVLLALSSCREADPPAPAPSSPQPSVIPEPQPQPTPEPSLAPELELAEPTTLPVPTAVGLPPISGFSVNARIHPHALPTRWHVEYGEDFSLSTAPRALPGRLASHFTEDWSEGLHGWNAGFYSVLEHDATGGPDDGPFVRYTDDGGYGNDVNHFDGIGLIHLGPYAYLGNYYWAEVPPLYLGGGFPDLRGATVSLWLRGVGWDGRGTELGTWIQSYRDPTVVEVLPYDSRYPNWAHTASPPTQHLASGEWEQAEWVLRNRTQDWTFAGSYGGRLLYDYGELESALSGVNVDLFVWQILYCDLNDLPSGSIDTAQLHLTYRQRSLCAPSNGGTLLASPVGGTGASLLTDGWRFGADHEWHSAPDPGPSTFIYAFERPVTLTSLNVVNSEEHPSREIVASVSEDGGATWVIVAQGELPERHELGPNYAFLHADRWELEDGIAVWAPLHPAPVDRLKLEVLSGYGSQWGLGEIEVFGTGAEEQTDDDWYDVNADVLVPSGSWSFRVVAESAEGRTVGAEQVVVVP